MAGALQLMLMRKPASAPAPDPIAPYFVSKGSLANGTAGLVVLKPDSYADGDVLILLVESANQAITAPAGFTQVANSPQFTGTAAAAGGVRLAVFYQVVSGDYGTSVVSVADSGNHTTAQLFAFRGADISAPIDVTAGSVKSSATGTTFTLPAVTTSADKALVLLCVGQDRDAASTTNLSAWTNANLASITELADQTVTAGAGGGIGLAAGEKATAGSTGTSTVTSAAATTAAFLTVALKCNAAYFDTLRVTGAYGSVVDVVYADGQATARVTLKADGTIVASGGDVSVNAAWVNLPDAGVGSGYWVRASGVSLGGGTNIGPVGTWLQLNSDLEWLVEAVGGGGNSEQWGITFEFATDSAGTTIVGKSVLTLEAQSNSGPAP